MNISSSNNLLVITNLGEHLGLYIIFIYQNKAIIFPLDPMISLIAHFISIPSTRHNFFLCGTRPLGLIRILAFFIITHAIILLADA